MSRFVWQCITYTQSEFEVDNQFIRPLFILGFSDVNEVNNSDSQALSQWLGMLRIAGLAHVGSFDEIKTTKNNLSGGWRITFSSSTYFYLKGGKYHRFEYNIRKNNVGNCAD